MPSDVCDLFLDNGHQPVASLLLGTWGYMPEPSFWLKFTSDFQKISVYLMNKIHSLNKFFVTCHKKYCPLDEKNTFIEQVFCVM